MAAAVLQRLAAAVLDLAVAVVTAAAATSDALGKLSQEPAGVLKRFVREKCRLEKLESAK
jgi:hypothetical protein